MAALKLGLDVNTSKPDDLDQIVATLKDLRAHLRGFDSDDYDNLLDGNAWMTQAWSGDMTSVLWQRRRPDASTASRWPARARRSTRTATRSRQTAAAPGHRAAVHRLDAQARRTSSRTSTTSATRCRCKGTETAYEEIVASMPQCVVTVDDLKKDLNFRNGTAAAGTGARQRLDRREGGLT